MEYSVIKWIKNSTVVSGTTTLTVSQLNGLVDGNLTSPAITISGTQKISIFVDTGSRFAISSVRLWMDNSSTVGTTIEYDYTTNVYTGITESDVVFTTASGLAYDPSGYVYASFSYPQDTPRFLRITQTCSGIGDINISEVQVINNEDYVDFGTNGTQTTIKMDHAPIGYESPEPTTVSIYNDTDSLTDATVLIENTGNSVDRMIKICATEDGTFIGREDYTTLPDQIPFENGNFVLSDVISDKIESVAKGNVVPSGTTAFTFEVYDTGMNTEYHFPCHCVGYDSILKKQIFLGMNSWWYGAPWSKEGAPYYGYRGAVHVLFDGYNSFSFINRRSGFPWNSAKSIYWASDNLMAVAGDPVGDYFYSLEGQNMFAGGQDWRTWAIHKFSNFCSTHVLTYSILAYSDTEYWNYCKKLGVGRTCLYTASNLGIAKRSKDTLEKESELTYTSVFGGGGNDFNITACNITGVFVGTSLLDDDVVFVFGPLDNAVNTLFRLSKIRYSTGELIDNTTFNINNACSNLDQIRSMTSDLLDQVWLVYSNGNLNVNSTGNLMVFSSSLDLYSNVNYTWFDKVYTVECSPFTGDIYLFVPVWSVTGPPALGDGDVHDLYSGTIVKVTTASESYSNETVSYYETPVIDIGADYNFSNVEYVEITSGLEHIDKYLDGGTSIIEVRASNVVPEAVKTEGLGESYINSVYLPDVATLNTQIIDTMYHMPCVTYDSNLGYIYLGGTLISWQTPYDQDCLAKCKLSDGTGLTELTKASVESLFPRRLNCMEYCQDPKDDLYYIYGVCSNGSYYRIKKYDIIANSWSMLVGGYNSGILNNNTKTCYDNINKCIHIMSTSVATGSALYYLYKFDIETETLTDMTNYGVVGSGRLIGAPSTVYYPPSISFINYNGVVRLMGFFDNNSIGSNYYVQFYDPSHPESGWSITTPYVAGTPNISRPSDDSIWDGSNYRWFTGNGTLQAGDKVYKVKGQPGYAWAHTGVHIIGDNTTAGSLVRRFAYYSLTENKWYQLPDLPVGPAGGEHYFGSGNNVYTSQDKLFLLDDDTILYVPLTSAITIGGIISEDSWHYRSLALIMYKYSINDQAWSSGYLPASGDPVWDSLEYNDVQKDSILMPQGRYVQAKLYFVNSSSASAKIDSITIPSGLIVQDVPPHGYKNMYVKTDIPLDVSVATKTAKLKVWWDLE